MHRLAPAPISDREAEVLAALGEGRTNIQIANRLHISVRTVESHVSSLLRKLGAPDRHALAALAGLHGSDRGGPSGMVMGLPYGHTAFVGRAADRDAVVAAVADSRLVSIVGPGGMGKTRLATVVVSAVRPAFPAGVAFVDLVPVHPGLTAQAVASALGVSERSAQELDRTIAGWVREARFLLILDNCEHLVEDVGALVGSLLERCPNLTVLATTRQRLGVPGERVVRLGPLPVDPDGLRLFCDRARAADSDLEFERSAVMAICDHLDGMPLAIEIAAARASSLGLDGLKAVIRHQLRLLSGARGVPARHASLEAVMAWSFQLLNDQERATLRALSVFTGRFDLASATAVVGCNSEEETADSIGRLVDRSLVDRDSRTGHTRWRLLETVRAFAAEQLDAADRADVLGRYLTWAAETANRLEAALDGDSMSSFDEVAMSSFDEVADDLRAALASTPDAPDATAHGLARSLAHLTFARGFYRDSRRCYRAASARAADASEAVEDLRSAASVATAGYDGSAAFELILAAADRAQAGGLNNAAAAAWASAVTVVLRFPGEIQEAASSARRSSLIRAAMRAADPSDQRVAALIATARAWHEPGTSGSDLAETAIKTARTVGDPILLLGALDALTKITMDGKRIRDAHRIAGERLSLIAGLPRHDPAAATEITDTFHAAAQSALACGELPVAVELLDRARTEDPLADDPYATMPRRIRVFTLLGRFHEAIDEAAALWREWQRDGAPPRGWMSTALAVAAMSHGLSRDGHYERWRARALSVFDSDDGSRSPVLPACLAFVDARVALHNGRFEDAHTMVGKAFAAFPRPHWEGYARAAGAELAVAAKLPDAEGRIAAATPYGADNRWVAACLARARGRLTGRLGDLEAAAEQWAAIDARFERAYTLTFIPDRADEGRAALDSLGARPPAG